MKACLHGEDMKACAEMKAANESLSTACLLTTKHPLVLPVPLVLGTSIDESRHRHRERDIDRHREGDVSRGRDRDRVGIQEGTDRPTGRGTGICGGRRTPTGSPCRELTSDRVVEAMPNQAAGGRQSAETPDRAVRANRRGAAPFRRACATARGGGGAGRGWSGNVG